MSFKDKLKTLICETASQEFMDQLSTYPENMADLDIENEIMSAAPLYGVKCIGSSEGVISFSTFKKDAVVSFTTYLDNNDHVHLYDISVGIANPLSNQLDIETAIDFDSIVDSNNIEFYIDVVIDPEYVTYNDNYIGTDDDSDYDFDVPYDLDLDQDSDNYTPDFDIVSSNEVPLLVKVSNTVSANETGRFLVAVHQLEKDKILIQCVYDVVPTLDEVNSDLEILNNGLFFEDFNKLFVLQNAAEYFEDSLMTTSAVYVARSKSLNAVSVVESLGHDNEVIYDAVALQEIERKIKVNFRGKRRVKMQCSPGFKYDEVRKVCVKISGSEMATSRIAHRQMARTKKSLGNGYKTRIVRKIRRAKRFRKMMGLK